MADARANHQEIFAAQDPLALQPFELRYLAGRRAPERWVIDLGRNDDVLIRPQNYYLIDKFEDRLFIPAEYAELFVRAGWRKQP